MNRLLAVIVLSATFQAQTPVARPGPDLAAVLNFETDHVGTMPQGWGGGPPDTIAVDHEIVHGGRRSVRLARSASSGEPFSTITKSLPIDFQGGTLEWRGFLRTEDVSSFTGLWMREDGAAGPVAFDNMEQRQVNGTRGWTEYSITFLLSAEATTLVFGVLVAGTGTVWADDLQLLVDGKPVWEAPKVQRPETAIDLIDEFDAGSGIVIGELSQVQIANLATLGKVWGFLKAPPPGGNGRQTSLGLRAVSRDAEGAGGPRPRHRECCPGRLDSESGRDSALPPVRDASPRRP